MTAVLPTAALAFGGLFWWRALGAPAEGVVLGIAVLYTLLAALTVRTPRPAWLLAVWIATPAILVFSPSGPELSFALSAPDSSAWQVHAVLSLVTAGVAAGTALVEMLTRARGAAPTVAPLLGAAVLGAIATIALPWAQRPDVPDAPSAGADLTVELVDTAFEPNLLTLPAGERVVLRLENTGELPHTLSIDEVGLDARVPAGRWTLVEFEVPTVDVAAYCSVGDHRAQGMQAVVRVTS